MIEVSGLTKYFGDHAAIRDLNFSIQRGEVIGFLGLNGAGKSTSLRILGCVLLPTAGRVTIDGFDVGADAHEIRKRIGFLPDVPPLYPEMTVGDYLGFVAQLRGVGAGEAPARVADAERKTALTDVHDVVIAGLSHGFRQRVGLAQAIVHNPSLLILDEPTSGLDPEQIVEMRRLIRNLRGEHTILLSSHNLPEVSQTCDRLLVIHEGRIVAQGDEAELVSLAGGGSDRIDIDVAGGHDERARAAVAGMVSAVEVLGAEADGAVRLRLTAPASLRPQLVRALSAADVDVLRVDRGALHLESIFLDLTRPRAARAGAPS